MRIQIGIKDVKKQPICEGDVLVCDRKTIFNPDVKPIIVKVVYDNKEARFWIEGKNIDTHFFSMSQLSNFEIIGNVYDNPALEELNLNKKEEV